MDSGPCQRLISWYLSITIEPTESGLDLHKKGGSYDQVIDKIYKKCQNSIESNETSPDNHVKALYAPFTQEQISDKIADLLKNELIEAEIEVIFQTVEGLHESCPKNLGDWYFTGNYPTPGGCRVVNRAFINFVEQNNQRAY